jgi:hypothetical protein
VKNPNYKTNQTKKEKHYKCKGNIIIEFDFHFSPQKVGAGTYAASLGLALR